LASLCQQGWDCSKASTLGGAPDIWFRPTGMLARQPTGTAHRYSPPVQPTGTAHRYSPPVIS
jgi:hypothetical protein